MNWNGMQLVPVMVIKDLDTEPTEQLEINGKKVWALPGGDWLCQ